MEKITLYKITIAGLLILNLVLVAFLWLGRPKGQNPPFRAHERFGLSEQQGEQFVESVEAHKMAMQRIGQEQRNILKEYFTTLKTNDSSITPPVPQEALSLEQEKIQTTYDHFLTVKSMLNQEQLSEYPAFVDHVINRVIEKTQKSQPPRRKN